MSPTQYSARFRFYGSLQAFNAKEEEASWIDYRFRDNPGIKDPIEALGVPHTEVGAIIVNGVSVDFGYQLRDGDRVSVYPLSPVPSHIGIKPLRPPLEEPAFVLDVHLGKLARLLRLLGVDTLYSNCYRDRELVEISAAENRVLLTRDRRLLFHRRVVHGHFVHHTEPLLQAREVVEHFRLAGQLRPFSRCINCNGTVARVEKAAVLHRLEPKTVRYYDRFYQCRDCGQVYWKGAHFRGLMGKLAALGVESWSSHPALR